MYQKFSHESRIRLPEFQKSESLVQIHRRSRHLHIFLLSSPIPIPCPPPSQSFGCNRNSGGGEKGSLGSDILGGLLVPDPFHARSMVSWGTGSVKLRNGQKRKECPFSPQWKHFCLNRLPGTFPPDPTMVKPGTMAWQDRAVVNEDPCTFWVC